MTPAIDSAIDPVTGQPIPVTDPHYSVVSLYYRLLPIYQAEQQKGRDNYLNRVWHDYAVLLLQTAEALNLRTRPPGYKPAPQPPTAHQVSIDKNYLLRIVEVPVAAVPPDPDPATEAIQPVPGSASEYIIVKMAPDSHGHIAAETVDTVAELISRVRALPPDQRMQVITAVLA